MLDGAFHLRVQNPLLSRLGESGLAPADIDCLAMSHLHGDHTGNANAFSTSKWLIQAPEHQVAFSENATQVGFTPALYERLSPKTSSRRHPGHSPRRPSGALRRLSEPQPGTPRWRPLPLRSESRRNATPSLQLQRRHDPGLHATHRNFHHRNRHRIVDPAAVQSFAGFSTR